MYDVKWQMADVKNAGYLKNTFSILHHTFNIIQYGNANNQFRRKNYDLRKHA